jgi:hypothetical protein
LALICANAQVFVCNTDKHTIHIYQVDKNSFEYKSWNKPKSIDSTPDMDVISNEPGVIDGTGICRATTYIFKKGNVRFEVDNNSNCVEGNPPKSAVGNLNVFIKNELKSHYWCTR